MISYCSIALYFDIPMDVMIVTTTSTISGTQILGFCLKLSNAFTGEANTPKMILNIPAF